MEIQVKVQIDKIEKDCQQANTLVVIRCLTYNHESYIRDALEGFVMQKTNFPFVAIVHDDASTDGTAAIIREYAERYPDIIKPIYETENQYSKGDGSLGRIMNGACEATGAKYIAMCEGDDFWTDPNKLQIQVDFLESHPDYSMCYTKVKCYNQGSKKFLHEWGGNGENLRALINENSIATLTVMFLHKIYKRYLNAISPYYNKNWLLSDYPIWLYVAAESKIKFINETTGVYRLLEESASHSHNISKQLQYMDSVTDIKLIYCKLYNLHNIRKIKLLSAYNILNMVLSVKYNRHEIDQFKIGIDDVKSLNPQLRLCLKYLVSKPILLKLLNTVSTIKQRITHANFRNKK